MSINYSGTKIAMVDSKVPNGILYPTPTIPDVTTYQSYKWEFAIDKASVSSSTPSDSFNTMVAFLDTAIESKLIAEFIGTNTVDAYGLLYDVESNFCGDPNTSDMYTDATANLICKVTVKVKIS